MSWFKIFHSRDFPAERLTGGFSCSRGVVPVESHQVILEGAAKLKQLVAMSHNTISEVSINAISAAQSGQVTVCDC